MGNVITRSVACGTCRLCCINDMILLHPECGDDPSTYQTVETVNPLTGESGSMLDHKPNGECIYLGESGCTIYERRPAICRGYDCADQYASMTRADRRKLIALGYADKSKFKAGRRQWLARQAERTASFLAITFVFAVAYAAMVATGG